MVKKQGFHIAVMGATGAVGKQIIQTLEKRNFPISQLTLLSSARSAGTKLKFKEETITVQEAVPESFEGVDIALFSAGGSISQKFASEAVQRGAIVVDNTSAFRMDPEVPLVVPEVNEDKLRDHKGIIANPNCSTIQMVATLEPIQKAFGLKKVIVSTYQAVSGAGAEAIQELNEETDAILKNQEYQPSVLPVASGEKHYQIAFNAIPQIDVFTDNGFTFEEMKMINETKKIMEMPELKVAATCVRLPIETSHSESVYVELDREDLRVEDLWEVLSKAPGITLQDQPEEQIYPMPAAAVGKDDVFVGRIRRDLDEKSGFHMWIVSDNLLKGAALNTIQIAESLIKLGLVTK
ncbi:aspartate-semialdehyde dehydrogenase [Bacillus sp. J14TS2]|uniref:aspartate-semialdehyde dehydrogenase n=1 Tax=Bacillus sp. J14TS2 TaxID=2807188 RepID=UPI001B26A97C|nr:aspartate-semialdehyde dehydrogenase [Bacillus sp. J14TS2]GIN70419.1 aspartate-semialdehyde dehydrogenase [Bacillus sp. J14TS2]